MIAMEIWKDIKGYESAYQVSNYGQVRSLPRVIQYPTHQQTHKGKFLKGVPNSKGYLRVILPGKRYFIHRLVAEHFIPNPENLPQVNHNDGNKENNKVDNLEWVNNSKNQKHGRELGIIKNSFGEGNHSKLTEVEVRWILNNYEKGSKTLGRKALARKFNVSHQTIKNIIDRKKWKHIQP